MRVCVCVCVCERERERESCAGESMCHISSRIVAHQKRPRTHRLTHKNTHTHTRAHTHTHTDGCLSLLSLSLTHTHSLSHSLARSPCCTPSTMPSANTFTLALANALLPRAARLRPPFPRPPRATRRQLESLQHQTETLARTVASRHGLDPSHLGLTSA